MRTALKAFAEEPVRVVATTNRVVPQRPIEVPANAVLVDWLSYSQLMPAASLVVSHGGHGTVARALGAGTPVLDLPDHRRHERDRDAGRLGRRRSLAALAPLPSGAAALGGTADPRRSLVRIRAGEIAAWGRENDGAERGAELVENLARGLLTA